MRLHFVHALGLGALAIVAAGCTPNAIAGTDRQAGKPAASASPDAGPKSGRDAGTTIGTAPSGSSAAVASAPDAGPADDALPAMASEDLTLRARHFIEAVAQDSPQLAADFMFPREGYVATRDASDPSKVWEKNVNVPFQKRVHVLHKRMKGLERAQFVGIELGHSVTQVTPRKKDFKKPLWRVKHSKILVSIDGRVQRVELGEMTGYRGAWYLTRI